MSAQSYQRGGWKITADTHRTPDRSRNIMHGNNTLLEVLPGVIVLGRDRRHHGSECRQCVRFQGCPKTPTPQQDYCAMVVPQFQRSTGEQP